MIVSHNAPEKWYRFDITNDKKSANTRDICVLWGYNLTKVDYRNIRFFNDDWACNIQPEDKSSNWRNEAMSNNHLITADDGIRKRIATLAVGDQIRIKGKLADYSEARWEGGLRSSSTTRTDTGNGACEVVLVEELEVLDSHNALWLMLNKTSYYVFLISLFISVAAFLVDPRPERALKRKK